MFSWLRRTAPSADRPVPRPDPGHRIYAIGDVHGRVDLLEKLLHRIVDDAHERKDARKPLLVFLGDLVDRGDYTRETLEMVIKISEVWTTTVCLRGNHESALLSFIDTPRKNGNWLGFGGRQTVASYGVNLLKEQQDPQDLDDVAFALARAMGPHLGFIEETALMFRSGDIIFSHAGIDPAQALDAQNEVALLWGSSAFLEKGPPPGVRVVHGHWDNPEALVTPQRICVDTGAFYSGRLTAVRLDDETKLISVGASDQ